MSTCQEDLSLPVIPFFDGRSLATGSAEFLSIAYCFFFSKITVGDLSLDDAKLAPSLQVASTMMCRHSSLLDSNCRASFVSSYTTVDIWINEPSLSDIISIFLPSIVVTMLYSKYCRKCVIRLLQISIFRRFLYWRGIEEILPVCFCLEVFFGLPIWRKCSQRLCLN